MSTFIVPTVKESVYFLTVVIYLFLSVGIYSFTYLVIFVPLHHNLFLNVPLNGLNTYTVLVNEKRIFFFFYCI